MRHVGMESMTYSIFSCSIWAALLVEAVGRKRFTVSIWHDLRFLDDLFHVKMVCSQGGRTDDDDDDDEDDDRPWSAIITGRRLWLVEEIFINEYIKSEKCFRDWRNVERINDVRRNDSAWRVDCNFSADICIMRMQL